jgi:ADP-ribose pyrophosphatase YjhB (NUDIX family)
VNNGESVVEAALRETQEELRHSLNISILSVAQTVSAGALNACEFVIKRTCFVHTSVTGTSVTPVIGFIHEDVAQHLQSIEPNPDEVDLVFTRTLHELLDPAQR